MFGNVVRGAIAGAAGTTALNAATYLDMALRARPASDIPQQAVDELVQRAGHPVPGDGDARQNRLDGPGPLGGIATGVGLGATAGLFRPLLLRLPAGLGAVALAAAAMAGANGPLVRLGLTDPRSWSTADWMSDIVPHLAYGVVTRMALAAPGG